jgi:hypothetical protein
MITSLALNQSALFIIDAKELYSEHTLYVKSGEEYEFFCDPDQHWKDWFVTANPDGYFNPLALLMGLRAITAKCFCLCGAFDRDDSTSFPIGSKNIVRMQKMGLLSFFANDVKGFYGNNSGSIKLNITRLQ